LKKNYILIKFVALFTAVILFAGCNINYPGDTAGAGNNTGTENRSPYSPSPVINNQESDNKMDASPSNNKENTKGSTKENTSEKSPATASEKSTPTHSKDANQAPADALDNTKYSWWIRLNDEHRTPEITPAIQKMIDDHGAIYVGDTSKKVVYLTFDEGYEMGYTPLILDTLKEHNVKAAFFITGGYIDSRPDLVKRMVDEGHIVGNHTVNHPSLPDVSSTVFENELRGLEIKFENLTGQKFKYLRPPSGEYSQRTLEAARQLGYVTVFWSFAYADWDTSVIRGAQYAHDIVMKNLHNGAIFLLHAVSKDNAEALDSIIRDIKAQGYSFETLDKILVK